VHQVGFIYTRISRCTVNKPQKLYRDVNRFVNRLLRTISYTDTEYFYYVTMARVLIIRHICSGPAQGILKHSQMAAWHQVEGQGISCVITCTVTQGHEVLQFCSRTKCLRTVFRPQKERVTRDRRKLSNGTVICNIHRIKLKAINPQLVNWVCLIFRIEKAKTTWDISVRRPEQRSGT
jgi:hypothetical protein